MNTSDSKIPLCDVDAASIKAFTVIVPPRNSDKMLRLVVETHANEYMEVFLGESYRCNAREGRRMDLLTKLVWHKFGSTVSTYIQIED